MIVAKGRLHSYFQVPLCQGSLYQAEDHLQTRPRFPQERQAHPQEVAVRLPADLCVGNAPASSHEGPIGATGKGASRHLRGTASGGGQERQQVVQRLCPWLLVPAAGSRQHLSLWGHSGHEQPDGAVSSVRYHVSHHEKVLSGVNFPRVLMNRWSCYNFRFTC